MNLSDHCIVPDWQAPPGVRALVTTRTGGVSLGAYAGLNLGMHVGDDPAAVARNRALLLDLIPSDPVWLEQVHGTQVVDVATHGAGTCGDAALVRAPGVVCAVLTADCLPVLLSDVDGTVVAAVHAGWRGLAAGVLEQSVAEMGVPPDRIVAWLGPAIGPQAFEVGDEVRQRFVSGHAQAATAFVPAIKPGKWFADLYTLARQRLACAGLTAVGGGGLCTFADAKRFYSYRRDGDTGRFASMVWIAPQLRAHY